MSFCACAALIVIEGAEASVKLMERTFVSALRASRPAATLDQLSAMAIGPSVSSAALFARNCWNVTPAALVFA